MEIASSLGAGCSVTRSYFDEVFLACPLMIILRGQSPREAVHLAARAWDLGMTAIEVPVHVPEALESLKAVVAAGEERGMRVGAGTVVSLEQVRSVASAGAAYTVAPGLDVAVARASTEAGMPHLPGVASATEIQRALTNGMSWVKAFPAGSLGTSWFRAMRGPFPGVRTVATGGIGIEDVAHFLEAGASAAGLGSALTDPVSLDRLGAFLANRSAEGARSKSRVLINDAADVCSGPAAPQPTGA